MPTLPPAHRRTASRILGGLFLLLLVAGASSSASAGGFVHLIEGAGTGQINGGPWCTSGGPIRLEGLLNGESGSIWVSGRTLICNLVFGFPEAACTFPHTLTGGSLSGSSIQCVLASSGSTFRVTVSGSRLDVSEVGPSGPARSWIFGTVTWGSVAA